MTFFGILVLYGIILKIIQIFLYFMIKEYVETQL